MAENIDFMNGRNHVIHIWWDGPFRYGETPSHLEYVGRESKPSRCQSQLSTAWEEVRKIVR